MRSTINIYVGLVAMVAAWGMLSGCSRKAVVDPTATGNAAFQPYKVADSSKIVTYPDGLQLYVVKAGPGDMPSNGTHVRMNYLGMLDDGTVFDESFSHPEPFEFTIGSGRVIEGIELAVKKLRLGSQAIAYIPPTLGYGDGKGKHELPPKIPANARLTFHMELVGSF